jgi:hypothetical protein
MMKRLTPTYVLAGVILWYSCLNSSVLADGLRAWGSDGDRQVSSVPAGTEYIAVAAGDAHALAMKRDGTVVAWGQNDHGQCTVPPGAYSAIGAGADFSVAIRADGSIAAWGSNVQKQISSAPSGSGFVSIKGGEFFAVALRRDGSVVAWGSDAYGQVSLAPTEAGFTAIAAGDAHVVALRSDGTLASWGQPLAMAGMPTTGTFTAIAAGGNQSLAIRSDGSIAWWGDDRYGYGLAKVPAGTDYVNVAAGYLHALALKKDGSVVGWGAGKDTSGHPNWGQANPPSARDYTSIACGLYFSLALTSNAPKTVMSDDFDDNSPSGSWRLVGDDLAKCRVEENRQRLELTATAGTGHISTFYLGNGWGLDATKDFSFQVDYHYTVAAKEDGGVAVLLATNANDVHAGYLEFGAGACVSYPYFWHEAADDTSRRSSYVRRSQDDGSLYVSYDAKRNELYLSAAGYGKEKAMVTTTMLSRGGGSGQVVIVGLGGGSDREAIDSGNAYLDNFRLDSGAVVMTCLTNVYRFWSPITGRHFYTTSEDEKNTLISGYSNTWTFEGVAFRTATAAPLPGLTAVHKFWAINGQTQFYTVDEAEKDKILREYAHVYRYDGVAFYAYPQGRQPADARPVYRFTGVADDNHFYTANDTEVSLLRENYSQLFVYEGIAFYACE